MYHVLQKVSYFLQVFYLCIFTAPSVKEKKSGINSKGMWMLVMDIV